MYQSFVRQYVGNSRDPAPEDGTQVKKALEKVEHQAFRAGA
jgi:hypothetical protein